MLFNNKNIVLKEADKGAAIVVMDSTYYQSKMKTMLQDSAGYTQIDHNRDSSIINKIKDLTKTFSENLSKKETNFLTMFEYKTSNLYGLPKIHKCPSIIGQLKNHKGAVMNIPSPDDLSFRPIVAGPACPTNRLSELINVLLLPYVKYVKSYIRDDIDILNKLPDHLDKNETFVTFDVESLYSNIRHEMGLEALNYYIVKYENENIRIPKDFIIKGADLILNNNTFMFDSEHYIQVIGTAMGTKFAPNYATLALGYLEVKLYNQLRNHYSSYIANRFINNYFRYLDDCIVIYNKMNINSDDILELLNSLDTTINFKKELEGDSVNFLDITVCVKYDRTVSTDIYYKPTDTKQYLNFYSCHPRHTKNAVPFNLARRICTIVSDINVRNIRLEELTDFLTRRDYPCGIIKNGIDNARNISMDTLRTVKIKGKENILPLVSQHNPNVVSDYNDIKTIIKYLKECPSLKNVYKNSKLINSKRQPPNLKKIICRAAYGVNGDGGTVSRCNKPRCKLCCIIITGDTFYFDAIK